MNFLFIYGILVIVITKTQMAAILAELERIAAGDSVADELLNTIDLIAITMQGLKGEDAND